MAHDVSGFELRREIRALNIKSINTGDTKMATSNDRLTWSHR